MTLWLEELRDDVKFAFRQLRAAPAFTLVAVLTLALGIGANSAIFALVDATLLRPLPYRDADRLVTIWETSDATRARVRVAAEHARLEGAQPHVRDDRRLHAERRQHGDGRPRRQRGNRVAAVGDGGIFDVLGVTPIAGRTFMPDDEQQTGAPGRDQRGLLGERASTAIRDRRQRDQAGRTMLWTVVGVMPKEFEILGRTSMWAMRPFPATCRRARAAPISCRSSAG